MDSMAVAIGGVVLIPLIIGLVQAFKRADPNRRVPSYVWFYLALLLGIIGQVVVFLIASGIPVSLADWAACVVLGLSFGLAAGKAYDETMT